MSEVLDRVREKYPQYKDVPDDDLALGIGSKYPAYIQGDEAFKAEFQKAAAQKSLDIALKGTGEVLKILTNPLAAEASSMSRHERLASETQRIQKEQATTSLAEKAIGAGEEVAGFVAQMSPLNVLKRTLELPTQIEQAAGLLPPNAPSPTEPVISPESARKVIDYFDPHSYDEPGSMREGVKAFFADTLSGLTSPDQAAAIVAGVKEPELVGRLFQVETAAQIPQAAQNLSTAIESGDKAAIGKASAALATTAAIPAAIEMGLRTAAKPKPTGITPTEEIKTVAPATAAALEQTGKGPSAIQRETTEVLQPVQPQPEQGVREVPAERPSPETGARSEQIVPEEKQTVTKPKIANRETGPNLNKLGDPIGTTYYSTREDWDRLQELSGQRIAKIKSKQFDEEYLKIGQAIEDIRNKYGGMTPKPPINPADLRPAIDIEGLPYGDAGKSHADVLQSKGIDPESIPHKDPRRGFIDINDPTKFINRKDAEKYSGLKGTAEAGGLDSQDLPAQPTPTATGMGQPQAVTQPAPTPVTQERIGMGGASPSEYPGSKDSLQQLTENIRQQGQISPQQSFSQRLKEALGGIAAKWKDRPQSVGQALEGARAASAVLLDKYRNLPKFTDFKKAILEWSGADNQTALHVRKFVKQIKKAVPSKLRQEAITNWIQADGDEALLRSRAATSKASFRRGYEAALTLTEPEKVLAANIKSYLETRLNEGINAGLIKQGIDNYITQIWKRDNPITKALRGEFSGTLNPTFKFARKRIFDSYFEGEQAGYAPKDKSVGALIGTYDLAFNRALSARALIKQLHEGKAADGQPIVMISGKPIPIGPENAPPDAVLIKPRVAPNGAVAADGRPYRVVDHWALRDWKWATTGPEGAPVFMQGDMLVHPDHYQHLKNVLSTSRLAQPEGFFHVTRALLKTGALMKQTKLSLSLFHLDQEGLHAMAHRVNPVNLVDLDMSKPEQKALVNRGLLVADPRAQELFSEGLTGGGLVSKIPVLGQAQSWFNDFLFRDYIPRLKMTMALDAMERNRKVYADDLASGKITEDQLLELTANEANAAFGELNYRALGRNPNLQDFLRLSALAPDFLEARARFAGRALMPYGQEQLRALMYMGATLYVGGRILNQWLDGDPHYDKPFSVQYKGREYRLRTILGDVQHLLTDPRSFFYNRVGPFIRGITEAATGRDDRGIKRNIWEQLQDLASWFIPIPAQIRSDQTATQAGLQSVGVSSRQYTAQTQLYQLVDKWKQNNPDPAIQQQYEQHRKETLPDSIYRPLRDALKKDDMKKAREEYDKLLPTHTPKAINMAMQPNKPFTGSWTAEAKFRESLSPEEQALYDKAVQERKDLYEKFLQLQ